MAISTNFNQIKSVYNEIYWNSIDEFEEYYLRELSERLSDTNYYIDRDGVSITIKPINHYPKLKEYEVWMEGFAATGAIQKAHLVGKAKARWNMYTRSLFGEKQIFSELLSTPIGIKIKTLILQEYTKELERLEKQIKDIVK